MATTTFRLDLLPDDVVQAIFSEWFLTEDRLKRMSSLDAALCNKVQHTWFRSFMISQRVELRSSRILSSSRQCLAVEWIMQKGIVVETLILNLQDQCLLDLLCRNSSLLNGVKKLEGFLHYNRSLVLYQDSIRQVLLRCTAVRHISVLFSTELPWATFFQLPSLEILTIEHTTMQQFSFLHDLSFSLAEVRASNINELTLGGCSYNWESFNLLSTLCPHLQRLTWYTSKLVSPIPADKNWFVDQTPLFPNLHHLNLELDKHVIPFALHHCPNLRSVRFAEDCDMSFVTLWSSSSSFPHLTSITIGTVFPAPANCRILITVKAETPFRALWRSSSDWIPTGTDRRSQILYHFFETMDQNPSLQSCDVRMRGASELFTNILHPMKPSQCPITSLFVDSTPPTPEELLFFLSLPQLKSLRVRFASCNRICEQQMAQCITQCYEMYRSHNATVIQPLATFLCRYVPLTSSCLGNMVQMMPHLTTFEALDYITDTATLRTILVSLPNLTTLIIRSMVRDDGMELDVNFSDIDFTHRPRMNMRLDRLLLRTWKAVKQLVQTMGPALRRLEVHGVSVTHELRATPDPAYLRANRHVILS